MCGAGQTSVPRPMWIRSHLQLEIPICGLEQASAAASSTSWGVQLPPPACAVCACQCRHRPLLHAPSGLHAQSRLRCRALPHSALGLTQRASCPERAWRMAARLHRAAPRTVALTREAHLSPAWMHAGAPAGCESSPRSQLAVHLRCRRPPACRVSQRKGCPCRSSQAPQAMQHTMIRAKRRNERR